MEDKPPMQTNRLCPHCGKHVLRQTTLGDFFDITSPLQSRLPVDFDNDIHEVTEKIGMDSKARKYRGMI